MSVRIKTSTLLMCALLLTCSTVASARDYLLTGLKPDKLALVDAAARTVEKVHTIPDAAPGILTVTPAADGKVAYAIVNHWESVAGIDLESGEQVFRADFSSPGLRTKAMFGMDISPDGQELYVFLSPVKIGIDQYEVQDTYIAVYHTADGVGARPVRTFAAPRRTAILISSKDGSKLYAIGWDITAFDPQSGEVLGVHKVRNWERDNYSEPDVLDVWPQWEQAGVFSTPYYAVRTDMSPDDPAAYKTGMLTLDLSSDELVIRDFENTEAIIFSSVINPVRPNEAYGVYTTLSKIDVENGQLIQRIDLDHTYYAINVSSDGSELYVGGTMDDIAVYSTETFERLDTIRFDSGNDQALASLRMIQR